MSLGHGAGIVRDGLVLHLDAANPKSYPGSGSIVYNLETDVDNFPSVQLAYNNGYASILDGIMTVGGENTSTSNGDFFRSTVSRSNIHESLNDSFTTEAFVNIKGVNDLEILQYRISPWRLNFYVNAVSMGFVERLSDGSATYSTNVDIINNYNEWSHFALTKTGNEFKFYKNGTLIDTTTYAMAETHTGSTGVSIGYAYSDDDYPGKTTNADFGVIKHYTKALSDEEIKQNFEALRGRYGI